MRRYQSDDDFFPDDTRDTYVKVAKRKQTAAEMARQLEADGEILEPAAAHGKAIATSFWGRAWCRAIEGWQDYESRLPAGRSLLKNGGVIDLKIERAKVTASVAADRLYRVQVRFADADEERMDLLRKKCAGKLGSLVDLISGNLSDELIEAFCDPAAGLFPDPSELRTSCDCLDDAVLCRHAAAVLYGIAARLDDKPELFFTLRGVDRNSFFDTENTLANVSENDNILTDEELADTFGIDIGS